MMTGHLCWGEAEDLASKCLTGKDICQMSAAQDSTSKNNLIKKNRRGICFKLDNNASQR